MSGKSVQIPVEYIITTTSDWTEFHIVEGGFWSNVEIECLKGCDKIRLQRVIDNKIIAISKARRNTDLVEVKAKCTLNVDIKYFDSQISHLITKGDLKSTTVRIIVQGKEIKTKTNRFNISGDPHNPHEFSVSTSQYVSAFPKLKTKIDYNELATRVAKFKKYERLFSFLTDYWFLAIIILLMFFAVFSIFFGRAPEAWEVWLAGILMGIVWVLPTHLAKRRVRRFKVEDDEWAIFYANSMVNNLKNYSETDNKYRKNDFKKKAVRNAKDFLSCIEKRWDIGSFKLAQNYFGEPLSELKKNLQYRVIPSLEGEDDKTSEKVEQIMRNFLMESRNLDIKGIKTINEQMSSRLNAIKSIGYRDRLSSLFATHKVLKHGLVVLSFAVGCVVFYHAVVSYGEIPKEYAFTGTIAGFLGLLTLYFRRQPKE